MDSIIIYYLNGNYFDEILMAAYNANITLDNEADFIDFIYFYCGV